MRILITGATGAVGQELGRQLALKNHDLWVVSRRQLSFVDLPFPFQQILGDLSQGPLDLPSVDAVVHLMGESVAEGRWTADKKERLKTSRIAATQNLVQSLKSKSPQAVLISASAVGFYGDRGDESLNETSSKAEGFLADLCWQWERASDSHSGRRCMIRIGIVLNAQAGALAKMLLPFQMGVGGRLGSGQQWMSWIHHRDLVNILEWALLNPKAQGIYNAVSPEPVRNSVFSKQLCQNLGTSLGPPVPSLALKILLGEVGGVVLASQKVFPQRLLQEGFEFRFSELSQALKDLVLDWSDSKQVYECFQYFSKPPEQIFPFFAEAKNLETITPPFLNFEILGMDTAKIQEGTLLDYKLQVHGVPVKWRTRISKWNPPRHFADHQLKGPYSLWQHDHHFTSMGQGTLMWDRVVYKVPLGRLGLGVGGWMVARDVSEIFRYRKEKTFELLEGKS